MAPFAAAAGVRAEAGLRLRFAGAGGVPLPKIAPSELPIYLSGAETIPGELYRQIVGESLAVIARSATSGAGDQGWFKLPLPEQLGFEDDCALLPHEQRSFRGYRLLSEYFARPERFQFIQLSNLGQPHAGSAEACDVVMLFSRNARTARRPPAEPGCSPRRHQPVQSRPVIRLYELSSGDADRTRP